MDIGLIVIRVGIGTLLAAHGAHKLTQAFGGGGIAAATLEFGQFGFRPARALALAAGVSQVLGGLLLALGLLTPLGATLSVAVMVSAVIVLLPAGPWSRSGGYEYALALLVVAAGLGFTGPGEYSLDHLLGLELGGARWGAAACVIGAAGATMTLARRQRPSELELEV